MPWSWAIVHITAGSTLPPTWTCSSANGPRDWAENTSCRAAGRALQLHLQPMGLERQTELAALLDVRRRALQVAGVDLRIGQLEPCPRQPRLLRHALLGLLQANLNSLALAPIGPDDRVDQRLLVRRIDDHPALGRDGPDGVEVGVADLVVWPEVGVAADEVSGLVVVAVDWPEVARVVGRAHHVGHDDRQSVGHERLHELRGAVDSAGR